MATILSVSCNSGIFTQDWQNDVTIDHSLLLPYSLQGVSSYWLTIFNQTASSLHLTKVSLVETSLEGIELIISIQQNTLIKLKEYIFKLFYFYKGSIMSQLIFYTHPMSRGRIIRWMLEEIGVSYETKLLDYGTTMKSAEYLAINPMGKVPAIVHNGSVVTETAAICAYLADAFPDAGLLPQTLAEKAAYFRWLFFAAAPLEQAISLKRAEVVVTDELQKLFGCGHPDHTFANLSNALKANEYIAGERFTAADIYIGSHIGFGLQFGHLPSLPEFVAYCERVCNRPAKLKADQIDDELFAQHHID